MPALVLFATVLLLRRSAGALVVPLTEWPAIACGLLLGSLAAASDCGRGRCSTTVTIGNFAMLTACAALTIPGMRTWPSVLLWAPVIGGLACQTWSRLRIPPQSAAASPQATPDDADLTLVRRTTTVGDECSGTARTVLTAGQKSAAIHLAFCPPFAAVPTAEVALVEASDVVVRPQPIYPYAARLEVRPTAPLVAPREIVVRFRFVVRRAPANSS